MNKEVNERVGLYKSRDQSIITSLLKVHEINIIKKSIKDALREC